MIYRSNLGNGMRSRQCTLLVHAPLSFPPPLRRRKLSYPRAPPCARVPQETGESTYDKPSTMDSVEGGGAAEHDPASEWAKYFDAEYAVDYYHNFRRVHKQHVEHAPKTQCLLRAWKNMYHYFYFPALLVGDYTSSATFWVSDRG